MTFCSDKPKMDQNFSFKVQSVGRYTIDVKNDKYTVYTVSGDTSTILKITKQELDKIQNVFLSKELYKISYEYNPNCVDIQENLFVEKLYFEYNSRIYSFSITNCEYTYFDDKKVKKIEEVRQEIYKIIMSKDNVKSLPKSNNFLIAI